MPKFENNFWITNGKTVLIYDAAPEDERVVVKTKVLGVQEDYLSYLWPDPKKMLGGEIDIVRLRRVPHQFTELTKAGDRGEAIGLQHQFAFQVMDLVKRMAVTVGSLRAQQSWFVVFLQMPRFESFRARVRDHPL
jgi:hypothetical protein